ncbi:type I-E CRISPR-associated protein Cas6/Cse3/CasE [Nocardiopsis sp. MG754419]|uniref:type I-E CRISPR-associated protein Cas6/Cse3/CasE n=1 Tax=Nocardiopsis sp. MG754419 TaxID=2259865 RepID=UPI001BA5DD3B|nr:type I-E CRISPR-associated protein Cas6/Cse3/CasE [Nocardiopsis sp. MG754419]MBR8741187.1 type I-E CRISPR-associated protein Cas6/Cse3/CasE [Nocardiopsis sp. MG754419]
MYLTNIVLDPERAPGMQEWTVMGRAVRGAVDPDPASKARVLWSRLSPDMLLVSSDTAPAWGKVPGAVSSTFHPLPLHEEGETVEWELITAPTERRGEDGRSGKRVPVAEPGFHAWLDGRLAGAMDVTSVEWRRLGGRPARYHFEGLATVVDGERLRELSLQGIGAGLQTGAGLLLTQEAL